MALLNVLHPTALPRCWLLQSKGAAQVLQALKTRGVSIRVASPKLVMEEAPESYKVSPCLWVPQVAAGS